MGRQRRSADSEGGTDAPEQLDAAEDFERAWVAAIDAEREGTAQLLHDTLAQSLNAARLYARVTRDTLQRTCPEASTTFAELEKVIQSAADEFQGLVRWLRPAQLEGADLVAALEDLCQLVSRTVPCELRCPKDPIEAAAESKAELLRIAQLALHAMVQWRQTNAVELELGFDDTHLVLALRAATERPLPNDREALLTARARMNGGTFQIQHEVGRGSTWTCRLPKQR
jgi:signal transduction histidine kinase